MQMLQSSSPRRNGITVACRVRPLSSSECSNPNVKSIINCLNNSIVINSNTFQGTQKFIGLKTSVSKSREFPLDHVFHLHCGQEEIYRTICHPVIKGLFQGINGSILAYGTTRSGKTHTMFGSELSAPGIIYRSIQDIFEDKERLEMEGKFIKVSCSFVEVYNEDVFDLLDSKFNASKRIPLAIMDNTKSVGIAESERNLIQKIASPEALRLKGLTKVFANSLEEFDSIIETGTRRRVTATTNSNAHSSRSHALVTFEVEVGNEEEGTSGTFARIRLCDLAGSERAHATSMDVNVKHRIEGSNINKSLLALGAVIQAAAKKSRLKLAATASKVFIPYRGSKLTRMLKDCLGGNCRTAMIFCISPSSLVLEESINTLSFAMYAKKIHVSAKRNEYTVDVNKIAKNQEAIIEKLRKDVAVLQQELIKARGGKLSPLTPKDGAFITNNDVPSMGKGETSPPSKTPLSPASKSITNNIVSTLRDNHLDVNETRSVSMQNTRLYGGIDSESWSELQERVNAVVNKKSETHRAIQECICTKKNLEMLTRKTTYGIAQYLTTLGPETKLKISDHPPVGVSGLLQSMVANLEKQVEVQRIEDTVMREQDTIDEEVRSVTAKTLRERSNNPIVEMLLDNANLKFSALNAEALATEYSLSNTAAELQLAEALEALHLCMAVIQEMLPLAEKETTQKMLLENSLPKEIAPGGEKVMPLSVGKYGHSNLLRKCQLALAYAIIPMSTTGEILDNFKRELTRGMAKRVTIITSTQRIEREIGRKSEVLGDSSHAISNNNNLKSMDDSSPFIYNNKSRREKTIPPSFLGLPLANVRTPTSSFNSPIGNAHNNKKCNNSTINNCVFSPSSSVSSSDLVVIGRSQKLRTSNSFETKRDTKAMEIKSDNTKEISLLGMTNNNKSINNSIDYYSGRVSNADLAGDGGDNAAKLNFPLSSSSSSTSRTTATTPIVMEEGQQQTLSNLMGTPLSSSLLKCGRDFDSVLSKHLKKPFPLKVLKENKTIMASKLNVNTRSTSSVNGCVYEGNDHSLGSVGGGVERMRNSHADTFHIPIKLSGNIKFNPVFK